MSTENPDNGTPAENILAAIGADPAEPSLISQITEARRAREDADAAEKVKRWEERQAGKAEDAAPAPDGAGSIALGSERVSRQVAAELAAANAPPRPPVLMTVSIDLTSPLVVRSLVMLSQIGLWGPTPEDVARTMLLEGMRQAMMDHGIAALRPVPEEPSRDAGKRGGRR